MSRLTMRKIREIFRQLYQVKRSYRDVANSLGISISTINDYVYRAKKANLIWPFPDALSEDDLYDTLFCSSKAKIQRPLPDWEEVHRELRKKAVTLQLLWREYKDTHPNGWGYTQFCGHYRNYVKQISPVMRQTHKVKKRLLIIPA